MLKISLIAALLAASCSSVFAQPLLPDPEQCLSSPGMERLAGSLFAQRFERGVRGEAPTILPADHPDTLLVQRVVDRLSPVVNYDRPNMRLQAKVVVLQETNAFCIPAGYIYVYTGMLDHIRKNHPKDVDDALAIVLGHEIAHAVLRHSIQSWRNSKDWRSILTDMASFEKVMLVMSRSQELEADRYGVLYAVRAGYKASVAQDVFAKFPAPPKRIAAEMLDHPTNQERVRLLNDFDKQLKQLLGLWDEAVKSASTGRLGEARTVLEILAAEMPNLPSVRNNLGWVYYQLYEQQAKRKPEFRAAPTYLSNLGVTVRSLDPQSGNLIALAQQEFTIALAADPDNTSSREGLAACAILSDKLDDAARALTQGDSPGLNNLRGVVAQLKGNKSEADQRFQASLQAQKSYLPALYNQAHGDRALGEKYLSLDSVGYWADQIRASLGKAQAAPAERIRTLAGVELGMTDKDVTTQLGQPLHRESLPGDTVRLSFIDVEVWERQGQVTMVSLVPNQVEAVTGLKAEASSADVEFKLGKPSQTMAADGGLQVWRYPQRGLSVGVKDSRVVQITIGES